jgi:prepilin-type N-terminal cleavage/methylation domain-containing protein
MSRRRSRTRAGMTLLEMLIALAVVGLVLGNVTMMVGSSSDAYEKEASKANLEDQLTQTLDRIVLALAGAGEDSLQPGTQSPSFHSSLEFRPSLGVQDGVVVRGDSERIELVVDDDGRVVWRERPEEMDGRTVTWTRWVRDFLEGEISNGIDDNGNGLVDESGLVFVIRGSEVEVMLTLQRGGASSESSTYSRTAIVHCRNS